MTSPRMLLTALALVVVGAGCAAEAAEVEASGPRVVGAEETVELLDARDDLVVIDVRTPQEYDEGALAASELIDIQAADFRQRIGELDRDVAYVVYCRSGNRSAQAVTIMADLGFTELYDAGGFADLAAAGAGLAG